MVMKKLDIRLLRLVRESKGQFISIMLVVILAITIYISMSMVGENLYDSILDYYDITNFGDVFIEVNKIPKIGVNKLENIEGVKKAQGRVSVDVPLRVEDPDEKVRIRLVSLPKEEDSINRLYILEGDELEDNSKSTVVLQQFSDARGIDLESKIIPYIEGREYPLEVRGIVGSPEYIYLMENEQALLPAPEEFGVAYVTEDFAQNILNYHGSYNEIMIKIDDEHLNRIDSILEDIEDELERYGVKKIIKRDDQLSHSMMMQEVDQVKVMTTSITILFLIVAAVIINIVLSRIIQKDRSSIGIMKGLGYDNLQILSHYVKYAGIIALISSVIGIVLSIPIAEGLTNLYIFYMNIPVFKMKIYYNYIIYGVLWTSLFCILSGVIGARKILYILPAHAMRPEAPKAGGRIWLEKIKFIWNRISFSWKMVIRNILRNKKRGAFLVLGIALTYSVIMIPVFISSMWNNIIDLQYGEFQTMDYTIDFTMPMNENVMRELAQIIDIEYMEPRVEMGFELKNGWRKRNVSIIAVPRDTEFYNFKTPTDKPLKLSKNGIVLPRRLANILGVKLGDEITIKSFIPDREESVVQVSGITEQYLGSNGYMDIEALNSLLKERNMITGVMVNSNDDLVYKLRDAKNIRQISSVNDLKENFEEFMELIIASVGIMMLFGGVLGFAMVYNVTIISINERMMEFSSLRVLGFNKKEIYRMITRENGLMTFLGIILGMPMGYTMCVSMIKAMETDLYSLPAIIQPSTYIITGMATIFFVILAQLATMKKVYSLDFLQALKDRVS